MSGLEFVAILIHIIDKIPLVGEAVAVGAKGVTISRLSPMGKVEIDGKLYEAKSGGEYIDQRTKVEVVGFENFAVIVKKM